MSLETMEYKLLKETAKRYGMEFRGNPSRDSLVNYVRSAIDNLDAPGETVDSPVAEYSEPVRVPVANKNIFGRSAGRNAQACAECGHTHVPGQFEVCQNVHCGKQL